MWTWDFAPPARKEFLTIPAAAQEALVALMEGIVGPDPLGIRRKGNADPGGVMHPMPFGAAGLVTLLIHVRGEQVLIVRIMWAGEG